MSLKQILIIVIIAVLISGGGWWLLSKQKTVPEVQVQNSVVSPTPSAVKLLTWNDEAGFTFQYPEGLKIDKHPDDEVNYANITFTGNDGLGNINILMKDDIYKSLDKWIKSNSNLSAGNIIDTSLGGIDGKKIISSTGEMIIGAIDNGVLVTIKKEAKISPLLETTWEKIINSWEFVYPTPDAGKAVKVIDNQDSGGDILEEEN